MCDSPIEWNPYADNSHFRSCHRQRIIKNCVIQSGGKTTQSKCNAFKDCSLRLGCKKKTTSPFFKEGVLESLVSLLQEIQMGQLMHLKWKWHKLTRNKEETTFQQKKEKEGES